MPQVTTEQRITFAILCALFVYREPSYVMWAHNWLDGIDRTRSAAACAATSAPVYATNVETDAETYAANTANYAAHTAYASAYETNAAYVANTANYASDTAYALAYDAIDTANAIKYTTYAAIAADPTIDLIKIAQQAKGTTI
jgi:hypothetical protein